MVSSTPIGIDPNWWRQATVYQIYPRSFSDANGDGIGDLKGITSKVNYLKDLGVDAIWLSPFYPSPLKDGGYDVSDYRNVDPRIGTLEDFDEMTSAYKSAGIKIIVDIVPNHCSNEHPWFQEALAAPPNSPARSRFVFKEGKGENGSEPPNDWQCCFGGSAWDQTPDGQWYLHLFDTSQPDFDWDHPEVQEDFLKTLKFWGDRGVSGFRVDVAHALVKDMSEPYSSQEEILEINRGIHLGKVKPNSHPFWDRDGVHDLYKEWRAVFNQFDPPLTAVAEAWVAPDRKHLYASSEGLGQAFSFDMLMCPYNDAKYKEVIEGSLKFAKESGSSTTWVFSNHDVIRHATRYGIDLSTTAEGPDEYSKYNRDFLLSNGKEPSCDAALGLKRARAATLMMLALPGSAYLYQGEELGLPEVVEIAPEKRQDPTFFRHKGKEIGRDGCRVPLPWSSSDTTTFGFSPEGTTVEPHLPPPSWWGDFAVDREEKEEGSTLKFYQKTLNYRRELQTEEDLEFVQSEKGVLHFKRPGGWEVVFNVSNNEAVEVPSGKVLVASSELVDGKIGKDTAVWIKA